jgi:hypothetical protein
MLKHDGADSPILSGSDIDSGVKQAGEVDEGARSRLECVLPPTPRFAAERGLQRATTVL